MRVISGIAKGRKLRSCEGLLTRPTTDRVKESVFNIINSYIKGAKVLDVFAGSGALGIEALSRGADMAVFTEVDKKSVKIIKENLDTVGLTEKSRVSVIDGIAYIKKATEKFDIIFADPPYKAGLYEPLFKAVRDSNILSGIMVVERESSMELPLPEGFEVVKERKYGNVTIAVLSGKDEINGRD